jgi:hypothetical protein
MAASDVSNGCAAAPQPATLAPATPTPPAAKTAQVVAPRPRPQRKAEARNDVKIPARVAKASYRIGDYQALKTLEPVMVTPSEVHAIDAPDAPAAAIAVPGIAARDGSDRKDASRCLKVDSDGSRWGFRNSCGFAVQFAYCMAGGSDSLTACGSNNIVTTSATGSVAAHGFGALMTDNSLSDKDASHNFRWIACGGGTGEVAAHLDHFEPPAGRCERAQTASAK